MYQITITCKLCSHMTNHSATSKLHSAKEHPVEYKRYENVKAYSRRKYREGRVYNRVNNNYIFGVKKISRFFFEASLGEHEDFIRRISKRKSIVECNFLKCPHKPYAPFV